jgi:thiol-disulfide isomerase/thioredoxin
MSKTKQIAVFIAVAVAAVAAGVLLHPAAGPGPVDTAVPDAAAASGLMTARLPDIEGKPRTLEQWRGKVLVVNFWATWCAPCREEIPAFIKVQHKLGAKGLQIVGIAVDQNDKVRPYAAEMKINYPILVGDLEAIDLARQAGNRLGGLPFTVVFDRNGAAIHSQLGGITQQKLEALVQPLL